MMRLSPPRNAPPADVLLRSYCACEALYPHTPGPWRMPCFAEERPDRDDPHPAGVAHPVMIDPVDDVPFGMPE